MKKYLAIFIIILLAGCSPAKRVSRIFQKHPEVKENLIPSPEKEVIEREIIKDSIIYKDRILWVPVYEEEDSSEAQVIIDTRPLVPKVRIEPPLVVTETSMAKATAWIQKEKNLHYKLRQKLEHKDTSIFYLADSLEKEVHRFRSLYNKEKETIQLPPEKFIPRIYKFTFWGFWVFVLLVILYVRKKLF